MADSLGYHPWGFFCLKESEMNIPLPAYIDKEAWDGFCEMRRLMPKSRPFSTRAAVLILYELQRIKDAGHCPNAALDQSTVHGWTDVYPSKDKEIARKSGAVQNSYLAEHAARAATATRPPAQVLMMARKVGRSA